MSERTSSIQRNTKETKISLSLNLDGTGQSEIETGIGFFDHMLDLFTKHGLYDLRLTVEGDLEVDQHHSVEDTGICLGQAFSEAVGDKKGIFRYGSMTLPMDETLTTVAVDLSGRYGFAFGADFPYNKIGDFDSELVEHFWQSFAENCRCNFHVLVHYGKNGHHISESIFKAAARALRNATSIDPRQTGVPSSKGVL